MNKSLKIFEQKLGPNNLKTADVLYNIGLIYKHKKQYTQSEELILKALQINENYFGNNNSKLMTILQSLSDIYKAQRSKQKYKNIQFRIRSISSDQQYKK